MKCPNCGSTNFSCSNSRNNADFRVRMYRCNNCEYRFKTVENVVAMKHPDSPRFAPIDAGANVDGREILDSLRKPMAEMRNILRTYDKMLK